MKQELETLKYPLVPWNLKQSLALAISLLALGARLSAQPQNPDFSLSTSTFLEINMKSIALVDIESFGATNFNLNVPPPTEAGAGFSGNPLATNSDLWINYSNAVPLVGSRNIEVSIASGSIPAGFEIQLAVSAATGAGGGVLGVPVGAPISLSATPQNILTGIRGAFTGDGSGNGHQLTYSLHFLGTNFHLLESENVTVNVVYTIIDN